MTAYGLPDTGTPSATGPVGLRHVDAPQSRARNCFGGTPKWRRKAVAKLAWLL